MKKTRCGINPEKIYVKPHYRGNTFIEGYIKTNPNLTKCDNIVNNRTKRK